MSYEIDTKRLGVGVEVYNQEKAYKGYTLYSPMYDGNAWLIDMEGRVVHNWKMKNPPGVYGKLISNGNLMWMDRGPDANEALDGGASSLLELDWDGNEVWRYDDTGLNHDFVDLPNGNIMIMRFVFLPDDIRKKIKVGLPGSELPDKKMYSNNLQEITREGKVVWEWNHWEHFDPDEHVECPLVNRMIYGYTNSLDVFPNGDVLLSIRHLNTVARISKSTGKVVWRWGPEQLLGHQHSVSVLESGNILIFDNGLHRNPPLVTDEAHREISEAELSRVVEVDPKSNEIVWEYYDPTGQFYTPYCGSAERLPNGNTLICESIKGIFFEVTPDKEVVWKYYQPFAIPRPSWLGWTISYMIFQIRRYGNDFKGFKGKDLDPSNYGLAYQKVDPEQREEAKKIMERLAKAGY